MILNSLFPSAAPINLNMLTTAMNSWDSDPDKPGELRLPVGKYAVDPPPYNERKVTTQFVITGGKTTLLAIMC